MVMPYFLLNLLLAFLLPAHIFFFFTRTSAFSALPKILGMAFSVWASHFPFFTFIGKLPVGHSYYSHYKDCGLLLCRCHFIDLFLQCKYHKRYSMT